MSLFSCFGQKQRNDQGHIGLKQGTDFSKLVLNSVEVFRRSYNIQRDLKKYILICMNSSLQLLLDIMRVKSYYQFYYPLVYLIFCDESKYSTLKNAPHLDPKKDSYFVSFNSFFFSLHGNTVTVLIFPDTWKQGGAIRLGNSDNLLCLPSRIFVTIFVQ